MNEPKILVNLKNYQRKWRIDPPSIRSFLANVWLAIARAGKTQNIDTEVTIVLLNDQQIECYNKRYRKKAYPTDVLSFPVNEVLEKRHYLGDILISLQRAADQATKAGKSLDQEIKILLLHGVLHLLGYDHETDKGQMVRLENRMRRQLGL